MTAPLCPVHNREMRPGKPGTKWANVYSCSEWVGEGQPGANQNGYCNQKVGSAQGGGRPAPGPAARPTGPSPAPSPGPAKNVRAQALEAASRVFQGAGANSDAAFGVLGLADQMLAWLTDDGAGER